MKKLVLILFLSTSFLAGAFAQGNFDNNPKVNEMRKEFYNKELLFTDAESKAFWPLFDQFQKEEKKLRSNYRPKGRPANDAEAEAQIEKSLEYDQKKAELKKNYYDKFSEVLPVRKVALLETTERKFKKAVLRKVRENRRKAN